MRFKSALVGAKSAVTIVPVSCSCRETNSRIAFMSARVETTLISTLVDASGELTIVEPLVPRMDRTVAGVSLGQADVPRRPEIDWSLASDAVYRPRLVRHRLACYAASTAGESWFCRTA